MLDQMGPDVWKLSSQMSDEQRSSLHLSVKPTTSFLSLLFSQSCDKVCFSLRNHVARALAFW
jgi:hypothetical protein